jgi:methyl-accepting chemotaxis protein
MHFCHDAEVVAMLRNMKIQSKFAILMLFLILAMAILFAISWRTVNHTSIGSEAYTNIVMAKDLTADILPPPLFVVESYMEMLEVSRKNDPGQVAKAIETIKSREADFAERKAVWAKDFPDGEMKDVLLTELCPLGEKFYAAFNDKFAPALKAGDFAKAGEILRDDLGPKFYAHREAVEKLAALLDTYSKQTEAKGVEQVSFGAKFMILGFGAVMLCVLVFFILLSRDFTKTFAICLDFARSVASGKLDAAIEYKRGDDFGHLGQALTTMLGELNKTIRLAESKSELASSEVEKARLATEEARLAKEQAEAAKAEGMLQAANHLESVVAVVSHSSESLSSRIEISSNGSKDQARRIAEAAAAMEEMNATVIEVARNAAQAAQTADQSKRKAQDGAKVVTEMVAGIGEVQAQAIEMKTGMTQLGRQAESIGQILNVIADIADQTNLLALNAAIEAARAGEAGRGFAVVADEVRKLAEKTMTATKEVGQAIKGVQDGTRTNIAVVERAVAKIDSATALANHSGTVLSEIVDLVDLTTDQVRAIAAASEQQSAASEEITRNIEEINRISSETFEAMEQSSSAVGELADQTQELKSMIDELKSDQAAGNRQRAKLALA